jgi:hypothetical protein
MIALVGIKLRLPLGAPPLAEPPLNKLAGVFPGEYPLLENRKVLKLIIPLTKVMEFVEVTEEGKPPAYTCQSALV